MKQFQYKDYKDYRECQISINKEKLHWVFAHESTMEYISSRSEGVGGRRENILCHGSRNGTELKYFRKYYPNANIIGTDISPTAKKFNGMVEWDFHNVNDEWRGKFDIVYSNSFDHSFDPMKALETWTEQLKPNGILCVEMMIEFHNKSSWADPLQLNLSEYEDMLTNLGFEIFDIKITKIHPSQEGRSRLTMSRRI
jgi:trans-aconitate methyltransferase